jgi:recombinational DNA repair protein RecR
LSRQEIVSSIFDIMNVLINALFLNQEFSGVHYYVKNLLDEFSKIHPEEMNIRPLLSTYSQSQFEGSVSGILEKQQ